MRRGIRPACSPARRVGQVVSTETKDPTGSVQAGASSGRGSVLRCASQRNAPRRNIVPADISQRRTARRDAKTRALTTCTEINPSRIHSRLAAGCSAAAAAAATRAQAPPAVARRAAPQCARVASQFSDGVRVPRGQRGKRAGRGGATGPAEQQPGTCMLYAGKMGGRGRRRGVAKDGEERTKEGGRGFGERRQPNLEGVCGMGCAGEGHDWR